MKHLREYATVVDKITKDQINDGPCTITNVTFKQEFIGDKYVETLEITERIVNPKEEVTNQMIPILTEQVVNLSFMEQTTNLLFNLDYLGLTKSLILIYITYKFVRFFF
jgi:hypothetical protein